MRASAPTRPRARRIALAVIALLVGALAVDPGPAPAAAASGFSDVSADPAQPTYSEFAAEIEWLSAGGISTGWEVDGRREYRPWIPISRDAMAAFLYRYAGSPAFTPPTASPFVDVATDAPFYGEIAWLASRGVSTGWDAAGGGREFRPWDAITRDAMAAFLYRFAGVAPSAPVPPSPFSDVPDGSTFAREISWLAAQGIAGGYDAPGGQTQFRPWNGITRDAMAAFLYRHATGGAGQFTDAPVPEITGDARVMGTVHAVVPGPWSPSPQRVETQWLRDGSPIAGATTGSYTLTRADAGRALSVRVTAVLSGYLRTARQSAVSWVPDDYGSVLRGGERLGVGATMRSADGAYRFDVNGDGNLTVNGPEGTIWESLTRGNAVGELRLGTDGVLSLVRPDGTLIWSSTPSTGSDPRLELRNDGALVVVLGSGRILWSSKVQGSKVFGLPFEAGQRWSAGGAHGDSGNVWNALDFGPISGQSRRVVTIADGVVGWISCGTQGYLSVDHGDGWRSTYYHLVNERRDLIGTWVPRGTYLGDVGRTVPCGGGATFDHVHLRITYEGRAVFMNGFTLGGYTAYSTGSAYSGWWNDVSGRTVLTSRGGAWCCLTAPR